MLCSLGRNKRVICLFLINKGNGWKGGGVSCLMFNIKGNLTSMKAVHICITVDVDECFHHKKVLLTKHCVRLYALSVKFLKWKKCIIWKEWIEQIIKCRYNLWNITVQIILIWWAWCTRINMWGLHYTWVNDCFICLLPNSTSLNIVQYFFCIIFTWYQLLIVYLIQLKVLQKNIDHRNK